MIHMMIWGGRTGYVSGTVLCSLHVLFKLHFTITICFIILLLYSNKLRLGRIELPTVVKLVNGGAGI